MAFDLTISPHQRGYTMFRGEEEKKEGRCWGGMNMAGRMALLSCDHSQIPFSSPLSGQTHLPS